jgi:hypothetical protein
LRLREIKRSNNRLQRTALRATAEPERLGNKIAIREQSDMLARMDLDTQRQFYAEEIRAVANLQSEVLVQAFAKVPREYFLGPGPWQIVVPSEPGSFSYRTTDDADPRHLYHNVLVAIDAERRLNNGQPSGLALWFDALDLQKGDRVSTSDARPVTILQSWLRS